MLVFLNFVDDISHEYNPDLENIVTPIRVEVLSNLLHASNYKQEETDFLIDGFSNGFDIGYDGPTIRQSSSANIPLTLGSKEDLWEKITKEVKLQRVAGPFDNILFENYIQSPIGLVPKTGGKTRMIFHLSYNFNKKGKTPAEDQKSLNACTPSHLCSVKYHDLDDAVANCLHLAEEFNRFMEDLGLKADQMDQEEERPVIFMGKTDLSSAFRVLPLKIWCLCCLVFKAIDPRDGRMKYFMDKCLPFGASISCSHYQNFSDVLRYIMDYRAGGKGRAITNYLDDFLFLALMRAMCNNMI